MKLRINHIPQMGYNLNFYVPAETPEEGWKIRNILCDYDLFQFDNKIKPDYCNMCLLEYWDEEEQEWFDWYDENGYSFEEHFNEDAE